MKKGTRNGHFWDTKKKTLAYCHVDILQFTSQFLHQSISASRSVQTPKFGHRRKRRDIPLPEV